ncbi:MAG: TonB-dependent receptor [Melioribacteraceae bacterium]|nr:TonB-dependent receptor [Melioribacteraceae bacterium]
MKTLKSLFCLIIVSATFVMAQENGIKSKLSEVIVSANKTPTSAVEIASSYSVITGEHLRKLQKSTVLEALRDIEGISITQQGGPGRLASVFIRGANSNHTLVLIDGIEMNDPSSTNNAYDLSMLPVDNIERIEIVRGPQSTLYGSDAVAGIINIITREGTESPALYVKSEIGSNNYLNGEINSSGRTGKLKYSLSLSELRTDGISSISTRYGANEKDGYTNISASAKLGYLLSDYVSFNFVYRFTTTETEIDQSSPDGDDPNYNYDVEQHVMGLTGNIYLLDRKWKQQFSAGLMRRISDAIDEPDQFHQGISSSNFSNATRLKFNWQNELTVFESNRIIIGLESENETANTSYNSESSWGPFQSIFPQESMRTNSIYLQDQININNALFVTLGIRHDNNERFGGKTTFKLAPALYLSSTNTKLKFTYGTGFKAPSLFYLFDPAFGNPLLKPEESEGWDLGIDQYLFSENISFGLTYFSTKFDDLIGFDANYSAVNIDKAETRGIETGIKYDNKSNLSIALNYSYIDAKDKSIGVPKSMERLIRRPAHKAVVNINFNPASDLTVNLNFRYIGEREDNDFSAYPSERVKLASYSITDLAASYTLFDYLKIRGRVENIFDSRYEEILYYGTLGRAFYGGLEITF